MTDIVSRLSEAHGRDVKAAIEGNYDSDPIFTDAKAEINRLRSVAEAARNLVAGARDIDMVHAKVDEAALVRLETALAEAGYDS